MNQPTKIYNQFDVVVVPFPFTDNSTTKRRPALIISEQIAFNTPMQKSVMAMITTPTHQPWALDVNISVPVIIYNVRSTIIGRCYDKICS
jgi:mRNA interferase MazF